MRIGIISAMQRSKHTNDNIIEILLKKGISIDMFKPRPGLSVASPMEDHAAFAFKIYGKPYVNKPEHQPIARPLHGMQHVAAVAMYVPVFANLFIKYRPHEAALLTAEHVKLMQIAALWHDVAREGEEEDLWDHESGLIIYLYLSAVLKVPHAKAKLFAEASANKDIGKHGYCVIDADDVFNVRYHFEPYYRPPKNIYQKLIHDSDCLDVIRARAEYDGTYLDFYQCIASTHDQALDDIAEVIAEAKSFITLRGDAYANLNITRKLQFENADVYQLQYALLDDRHPVLRKLASGLLSHQALHAPLIDIIPHNKTNKLTTSYLQARMRAGNVLGRAIPLPSCPTFKNPQEMRGELEVRKVKRQSGNPWRSFSMMSYGNAVFANAGFLVVDPDPSNIVEAKALDFNTGRGKKVKYQQTFEEEREFLLEFAEHAHQKLETVNHKLKLGGRGVLCERFVVTQSEVILRQVNNYDAVFVCYDATYYNYNVITHTANAATYYAPLLQAIYLRQCYGGDIPLPLFEYSGTHHYFREVPDDKLSDDWIVTYWQHAANEYIERLMTANKSMEIYQLTLSSLKILCVYGANKHNTQHFAAPDQKYSRALSLAVDQAITQVMNQCFDRYLSARLQVLMEKRDFTGYRETCLLAARRGNLDYLRALQSLKKNVLFEVEIQQLSPLHEAANYNQRLVLDWILTMVPADYVHADGLTAMATAADHGQWEAVNVLLQHGAKLNQYRYVEGRLLHVATGSSELQIIDTCLEHGLDPHQTNVMGSTPLHVAARYGQVAAAELLWRAVVNLDIDIKNGADETPLHLAAKYGQLAMVTWLLNRGANVELLDCGKAMPLNNALLYGHELVVQALLQAGANQLSRSLTLLQDAAYAENIEMMALLVQQQPELMVSVDNEGHTLLHNMIEFKKMKSLRWLLDYGVDINSRDKDSGMTPLMLSVGHWYEGFCYLLVRGAKVDCQAKNGETALYRALMVNKMKYVKPLLAMSTAELSAYIDGYTPLHLAVRQRNLAVTTLLLRLGANIEARDKECKTPLQLALHAVIAPDLPMMALLLENGANDNKVYMEAINREITAITTLNAFRDSSQAIEQGNLRAVRFHLRKNKYRADALLIAIRYGQVSVLRYLLQHGFHHDTALHDAVLRNQHDCLAVLLESKVDIEQLNQNAMTVLQCAVENTRTNMETMSVLLAKHPRLENTGKIGATPLQLAVSVQNVQKVKLLLEMGANITVKCRHQRSLLHKAVRKNNDELVKVLLWHQADIHSKDCNGNTPLHLAAELGQDNIVAILLKAGADPDIKNSKSQRPEQLAKKSGSKELHKHLRKARKHKAENHASFKSKK